MSESSQMYGNSYQQPNEAPTPKSKWGVIASPFVKLSRAVASPFVKLVKVVDRSIPNIRTTDGMAYALAKRTPRTIAVCLVLLFAGIVASRLNVWTEGFLWGIPSLGAIGMGIGFWVWSSNLLMRRDLSQEARQALQRAVQLQLTMVGAGILAMIYFIGMAVGLW